MGILEEIRKQESWEAFLAYKEQSRHISKKDLKQLREFIDCRGYKEITDQLGAEAFSFALPKKSFINKKGTKRKRIVYAFPYAEKAVLQLICFLLDRYDSKLCPNTYAFRIRHSVKDAAREIKRIPGLREKYALKVDIHDYFNSIPNERLVQKMQEFIDDDPELLKFLTALYSREEVLFNDRVIKEKHGAMAGNPISGFMANIYLSDIDFYFAGQGIPYFRYSDDIIIFTDTLAERDAAMQQLMQMLSFAGLSLNPDKLMLTAPGQAWDYLGFSYVDGHYDLSRGTILKTKARIKRYANYLYRKRREKGRTYEETVRLFLKRFHRIFFDETEENEFCWRRWYFTVITRTDGLHIIDEYMQEYLRYLYSGRHYKGNYKVRYEDLKALGYRNLVAEYYAYKSQMNEDSAGFS